MGAGLWGLFGEIRRAVRGGGLEAEIHKQPFTEKRLEKGISFGHCCLIVLGSEYIIVPPFHLFSSCFYGCFHVSMAVSWLPVHGWNGFRACVPGMYHDRSHCPCFWREAGDDVSPCGTNQTFFLAKVHIHLHHWSYSSASSGQATKKGSTLF